MQAFPHHYTVAAKSFAVGEVELHGERLPTLHSASPAEFGGPGDRWSPETLLVASVGDCLILTFRAIARASGLPWTTLDCEVTGTLDRVERQERFVEFEIHAHLRVPGGTDPARARRVLEKADHGCLIANSLRAPVRMNVTIEVATEPVGELVAG